MEIKININAPGLEKAINNLASALTGGNVEPISVTNPITAGQVGNWAPGGGEVEVSTETQKEEPKQEPTQAPVAETSEKEPATPAISLESVRVKLTELAQQGKQAQVKALISSYGVKRITDVPQDNYAELLEKASEL